jgi:hypothetical protein
VHGVAEAHHFAQKIRPMTETLEDSGHLLTAGVGAPFVVDGCNLAGCFRVLNRFDFHLLIGHGLRQNVCNIAKRLAHLRILKHRWAQ